MRTRPCGGRSLNDDVIDMLCTLIVNAFHGPRVSDGVGRASAPASREFPYLAPAEHQLRPPLPAGTLDDDGADRGVVFIAVNAHLDRQFEFVKSRWFNDGNFTGLDVEQDLLTGDNDGTGIFTVPQRPVRRRLHGVERFVTTRGGECLFLSSLSALRWLANLGA